MSESKWDFKVENVIPPEKLAKLAKIEVNEDPKRMESDIQAIREWLRKEPHLSHIPLVVLDERLLIVNFLRGCKYSLEKTKRKLEGYFTLRGALPEFFLNCEPEHLRIQQLLQCGIMLPLPHAYDRLGRQIYIVRLGHYDPRKFTAEEVVKIMNLVCETAMKNDSQAQILGFIVIVDMRDYTLAHVAAFTPTVIKKYSTYFQEGVPSRSKAVHYVHLSPGFEMIYSMVQSFLSAKLKKRNHVHGNNLNQIYKEVSREVLPPELGGTSPLTYDDLTEYWFDKVMGRRESILCMQKLVANEKLRMGKPRTQGDLFGIEGSFRKLEID